MKPPKRVVDLAYSTIMFLESLKDELKDSDPGKARQILDGLERLGVPTDLRLFPRGSRGSVLSITELRNLLLQPVVSLEIEPDTPVGRDAFTQRANVILGKLREAPPLPSHEFFRAVLDQTETSRVVTRYKDTITNVYRELEKVQKENGDVVIRSGTMFNSDLTNDMSLQTYLNIVKAETWLGLDAIELFLIRVFTAVTRSANGSDIRRTTLAPNQQSVISNKTAAHGSWKRSGWYVSVFGDRNHFRVVFILRKTKGGELWVWYMDPANSNKDVDVVYLKEKYLPTVFGPVAASSAFIQSVIQVYPTVPIQNFSIDSRNCGVFTAAIAAKLMVDQANSYDPASNTLTLTYTADMFTQTQPGAISDFRKFMFLALPLGITFPVPDDDDDEVL